MFNELFPTESQRRILQALVELFERTYSRDNPTYIELSAILHDSYEQSARPAHDESASGLAIDA